ncbi:hypothetical protein ATANTOWER_028565 [Ataeniobius toweri]|uniref:Uncharacterized protein n=1 Tax=Ataeniobius toweri TaxID=208326 RepID=A0ABU7CCU2_9TELE|nr:hypothetical protein [Ataeniobius toweri]
MAFKVDITDLFNILNILLQGMEQIVTQLIDHIEAFRPKLQLLCQHLSAGNLAHDPSLREVKQLKQRLPEYAALFRNLDQEFGGLLERWR